MTHEQIEVREAALQQHEDEMLRIYTRELNRAVERLGSAAGFTDRKNILYDARYYASQISKVLSLIGY